MRSDGSRHNSRERAAGPSLHAELRGRADHGSWVLLLHGLGSSSADWPPALAALEKEHRVVLVDLPGHGRSASCRPALTVEAAAAAVDAVLEGLGPATVHAVGLSLGGCVALALALRSPERVRSLTLVNAFASLGASGPRDVIRLLARVGLVAAAPMPVVAGHVARGLFPRPEQDDLRRAAAASLARTSRLAYGAAMLALARFDARSRLTDVRCPTLVVAGTDDRTVPLAAKRALAAAIPGASLLVVPGSGHATTHDAAETFARALLDFIGTH